jgi:cytochrome c oxidase subunit 2
MKRAYSIIVGLGLVILVSNQMAKAQDAPSDTKNLVEVSKPQDVGNKICPVTGEKIDEKSKATYEYKGKIYNFCCTGCIEEFKNDPEKYIKIVKEDTGQNINMEKDEEANHEGHHHEMGKKDEHMMMESKSDEAVQNAMGEMGSAAQVKEFNLETYQHGYSPERLVVKKGDIVKLHATSRDVPHGIFIKEYGINVPVKKGAVEEIEFIADKAGEFDILCSVYCGKGHHSMKAKLVVEE